MHYGSIRLIDRIFQRRVPVDLEFVQKTFSTSRRSKVSQTALFAASFGASKVIQIDKMIWFTVTCLLD